MIKIEKIENKKVYDITIEKNSNFFANDILVHNCAEILEVSKPDEIANCNLASMVLPKYVINGKFDFEKLREVSYKAIINLNKVIDHNFYPTPETKKSNFRHRPLGLGVAGLADVFALLDLSFDSPEAKELNKKIFETIYFGALQASCDLAKIEGAYETFEGSMTSKGILQFDLWKNRGVKSVNSKLEIVDESDIQLSGMWDFNSLKEDIKKYGLRNSLLTSAQPTASTSQIAGVNECFEAFSSNLYTRKTLSGEFVVINKYLVNDLIKFNLWNDDIRNLIILNKGSIQNIGIIPEHLKVKYRTIWEIKQKEIIDMAADRAPFICQTQSMNLFFEDINFAKVSSAILYGYKKGLKTLVYYTRNKPRTGALQSLGVDIEKLQKLEEKITQTAQEEIACSLDNPDDCLACSS